MIELKTVSGIDYMVVPDSALVSLDRAVFDRLIAERDTLRYDLERSMDRTTQYCTEVERLRAGIKALIDGSPDWKLHPDKAPRALGKCVHGRWPYDGCDQCRDEYLQRLLDGETL